MPAPTETLRSNLEASASATVHDNEPDVIADEEDDFDPDDDCVWCGRPARFCICDEAYERYKDERMGL